MPGIQRLDLTGSVRYDHYSDFGGTTNPKVGFTYVPINGITLRGTWGTSFQAPSLADTTGAVDTRVGTFGCCSPFRDPSSPFSDLFRTTVLIAGGNPDLKPQKATTWSLGADFKPAFLSGFTASVTYYNVHFTNMIFIAPFYNPGLFYTNPAYAAYYTINPTQAQAHALLDGFRLSNISSIDSLYAGGQSPYVIIDARRNNFGTVNTDGLDFSVAYTHPTSFGSIDASVTGNYILNRKSSGGPGQPFADDLANSRRFTAQATFGATAGRLSGQVRVSYSGGYPLVGITDQEHIDSFTTVDAFLSYNLGSKGVLKDTSITLNVDNIFDTDPPFLNQIGGFGNGSTLGRVVSLGFRKKF